MKNIFKITKKDNDGSISVLMKMAIPLIITNSSNSLMHFTDRMFLAWFSPDTLAACVPASLLSFTLIAFFMGSCGYTSVFVANYFGQKRYANLSVALWQGVLLGAVSWLVIILLTPLGRYFLSTSGHDPIVKNYEITYFTILTLFGGIPVINTALASFFTGQGRTAITMIGNIGGNIINIFLSYIMIFGKLGFPAMGISGAAYSTIISSITITGFFIFLLFRPEINKRFRLGRLFGFNKKATLKLVRFGIPNGFGMFMDVISFTIFVFFTGNIDKISLAASNIIMTLQTLEFLPLLGLSVAGQILMGQYMGQHKPDIGAKTIYNTLKISFGYVVTLCFCFLVFPHILLGFFMPRGAGLAMHEIYTQALILIPYLCLFTFGDVIYLCFGDGLRGAGDTKFQMKAMILCSCFLIGGSYIIVEVMHGGIIGAWTWMTIYGIFTGIIMLWRFLLGKWRTIDITK